MSRSFPRWRGLFFLLLGLSSALHAEEIYQTPAAFLAEVFGDSVPIAKMLWLNGTRRDAVTAILDHPPAAARLRYWADARQSAWIIDEIGKDEPITVGIVVANQRISLVKVLVFRESRGWEVRYPFFTEQFHNAALNAQQQLDAHIDGITGATLSVRAVSKLARLALYLDGER